LLATYGNKEQIDTWVRPMLDGRYLGTMCLSEPQAGSSLANITTQAVRQDERDIPHHRHQDVDQRRRSRNVGEHRASRAGQDTGRPPGVKGISLFVVPKHLVDDAGQPAQRNSVVLVGLNHKMGNRGTTNALLSFGDESITPDGRDGAVGYLVGEEFDGMRQMFHMMNEARIGVGLAATALGYTGYLQAVSYAPHPPARQTPLA